MNPNQPAAPRPGSLEQTLYPPSSRYHGLAVNTFQAEDGTETAYLERRFLPRPERFFAVREHAVVEGDRIDRIAAQYLGDPELYWRLCDANGAMRPAELTDSVGRRILITLPEGMAAPHYA